MLMKNFNVLLSKKNKNIILMFHNKGCKLYGNNMKFIAEEIIRQKLPCQIYFYVKHSVIRTLNLNKKNNYGFPPQIKVVYHKKSLLKIARKARVIMSDNFTPAFLLKHFHKKHQFLINTWHGSLGIKKIFAAEGVLRYNEKYKCNKTVDINSFDIFISNSDFETTIYKKDLFFNNKVEMLGHPRNDIFFANKQSQNVIRSKICEQIGLDKNKKIVLVAPTFMNELHKKYVITCYIAFFDFAAIKKAFEKFFNCEVQVLLRLHPEWQFVPYLDKFMEENPFLIDATSYPDIQELLVASDAMITDYSSCIFDFLFTKKPGFILAPDRKHYEMTRGLYFPLEESPFPVAEDNETLCKNIINFDNNLYQKRVEEFLKSRNVVDDGHASERVVELIKEHLK